MFVKGERFMDDRDLPAQDNMPLSWCDGSVHMQRSTCVPMSVGTRGYMRRRAARRSMVPTDHRVHSEDWD